MNKEELKLYSWVVRGSQRTKVLKAFNGHITPTQVKNVTKLGLNNVSDILRLFVKMNLAICLNEDEKLGRIYELTDIGKKIKGKLIE
tara:strand:- start:7 stop:267 length:261 start_codon:yes stop_codon:yes gene_type:complete